MRIFYEYCLIINSYAYTYMHTLCMYQIFMEKLIIDNDVKTFLLKLNFYQGTKII